MIIRQRELLKRIQRPEEYKERVKRGHISARKRFLDLPITKQIEIYRKRNEKKRLYYNINKDKITKQRRLLSNKYSERKKKWTRETYERHREKIIETHKRYRSTEKGILVNRLTLQRRLAKNKQVKHEFTIEEWKSKLEETNGFCFF